MEKLVKNTIAVIGLILCLIVLILNIFYITTIESNLSEKVNIEIYGIIELIITLAMIVIIYKILKKFKNGTYSKNEKIKIIVIILILYIILQIVWINLRKANPIFDQQHVYETAVKMYEGKIEKLKGNWYLELYPQQLTLATIYFVIFKIFSSTSVIILQCINAIANAFTILGILLITDHLGKDYPTRKIKSLMISITFITLPLLSIFVYGDILSIPMCVFAVYYIMKYSSKQKYRYAIISALLMSVAYITRMNNLIYIIAISIYILLDIFKTKEKLIKNILIKILILILFLLISIMPATGIKNFLQNKFELDNNKAFPTIGFLCMGMEDGERAEGWYNTYADWGVSDAINSKQKYKEEISNRIKYFMENPVYFAKFYIEKTASMWTENTYAAMWYNGSYNFGTLEGKEPDSILENIVKGTIDFLVIKFTKPLYVFQKAIILIIFGSTILTILKYRKNLTIDILLLITIFIGGFLFHTLWEAKSRYIISYIVILMPIVSIQIEDYAVKKLNKIKDKFIEDIDKKKN